MGSAIRYECKLADGHEATRMSKVFYDDDQRLVSDESMFISLVKRSFMASFSTDQRS